MPEHKDQPKAAQAADKKDAPQQPAAQQGTENLMEEDDLFEEFANQQWTSTQDDEVAPMWEADWDDQDAADDFAARLKNELDKSMKE